MALVYEYMSKGDLQDKLRGGGVATDISSLGAVGSSFFNFHNANT
jgi:hypothetical protein